MNNNLSRILKIACTVILIAGIFSKHLHYPGGAAEIVLSTALIIILTCVDCIIKKDKFNMLIGLSLCVMFIGAMFKAQHWPGASTMAGFGVGLSIAITLFMSFRKDNAQLSQQNGLSVFLLLIFVVTLMQNNPLQHMLEKETEQPTSADTRIYGTWMLDTSIHVSNGASIGMAMLYVSLDSGAIEFQKDSVCIATDKHGIKSKSKFFVTSDTMFVQQEGRSDTAIISFNGNNKLRLVFSNNMYCPLVRK